MDHLHVQENPYRGEDHWRYRVLVTRNSEYHCRSNICVVVRDRVTGALRDGHAALGRRLLGGLRFDAGGGILSSSAAEPRIGDRMYFSSGEEHDAMSVTTSALCAIECPRASVVARYPVPVTSTAKSASIYVYRRWPE
jgi:hypothetical protein